MWLMQFYMTTNVDAYVICSLIMQTATNICYAVRFNVPKHTPQYQLYALIRQRIGIGGVSVYPNVLCVGMFGTAWYVVCTILAAGWYISIDR